MASWLWLVPDDNFAMDLYTVFHGRRPKRVSNVNFNVPRQLIYLGRAVAIEYECNKLNGGGDGKTAVYRHEFETPSILCMDERAKKQLYILGEKITVDDSGIRR